MLRYALIVILVLLPSSALAGDIALLVADSDSYAVTRAIISATEAKTAALSDMDVRSSYSPRENQATGTGTDNVLVVEGTGAVLDNAGGHSKLDELMARAVYAGVKQAVWKQNKLSGARNIFQRLQERDIELYDLCSGIDSASMDTAEIYRKVEGLLLDSRYAGFMRTALAVSRGYQNNLITDLSVFRSQCLEVAGSIAGKNIAVWTISWRTGIFRV